MGFRPEPTIFTLNFEGTYLDGLKVRISSCTVREYGRMLSMGAATGEDIVAANTEMLQLFVDHLKEWDLEDQEGNPVPTTMDGIQDQERGVIARIIQAWQMAVITVPPPSGVDSKNGGISLEQSLDLGGSSQNLQS